MTKEEYLKEHEDLSCDGIKNIEITFENCETATIPRDMIGQIIVKDFEKEFSRIASNHIGIANIAKYIIIQIKDKNQKYKTNFYGIEINDCDEKQLIERMKYNDIAEIRVNYLWDESYSWYVDYDEEHEEMLSSPNILQTTKEYFGDVWIAVGENAQKDLDKYLPKSQEDRDFIWEMYKLNKGEY